MATKAAVQTLKCAPQPQDRNPSQGKSGPRGKRKLEFDLQRFKGKSFFLDLNGYRHAGDLEQELAQRGATIEKFFHRDVKYLVTNRLRDNQKGKSCSPSTLSPNTPGTAKSNPSQLVSPLADSSETRAKQPPPYQTRAQKLLQMSLQKQKKTAKTDIVSMARDWGCKIVYLDELLTELSKLKPLPQKDQKATLASKQAKVRSLRAPCFKVEDLSRGYRPLVYETNEWPRPDPASKASPFDSPKQSKGPQHAMRPPQHKPNHTLPPPVPAEKKPGYCECCAVRYEDLQMHLGSAKHMEYASNSANFTTLDDLIAKGTSFSDFIAGVRSRHQKATKSPSKPTTKRSPPVRKSPRRPAAKTSPPARNSPHRPVRISPRTMKVVSPQKDVVVLVTPPCSQASPSKTPRTSPRTLKKGCIQERIVSIPEDVALSPHQLELCLVRVVNKHEYTPGFVTPLVNGNSDARSGLMMEHIAQRLATSETRVRGATLKRMLDEESPSVLPPAKKVKHEDPGSSSGAAQKRITHSRKSAARQLIPEKPEVIPETPEKIPPNVKSPISPGLCNLHELLDNISSKMAPERTPEPSPNSQKKRADGTRRSPRLLEKEQINDVTVSYGLHHTAEMAGPSETPEIFLQGVPPFNKDSDSPFSGIQLSSLESVAEEGFNGFSPNAVRNALPDFISAAMKRSPRLTLQKLDVPQ